MTEFITRANYEDKNFEIIIKTDSEAHYKLAETFSRALIDDCNYEKVVRCKDCKYHEDGFVAPDGHLWCEKTEDFVQPNDYCSYGEAKDNIVHCRDCKYREKYECNHITLGSTKCGVTDDWFCADGERRESE